ncbi:MAG: 30S ribosomal protein S15 [Candidatus Komeilibacteria bacterium CG_4_10_14_0_2_um_filter_37_10]|uniref:Small ribosomal subunit protein uS15 n=1 Tax=Candidatus Komeilibacteria bacterium CG_4_10_14_0_2_um_filter_37_10 TaxID=1974470 RepID=A0A2M7VER3_9BACT|nr:MAG: 30S ribosomal protein S15 [Candidatus Komeilibacteria bacterium CG_4_10_14_0_2_um_filter_37_10]
MLDKKKKNQIIEKFKTHANDTGSPEIQIAILTAEIAELTEHLKIHKKDFSSRRGLIRKVNQRRKLLRYLEKTNEQSFDSIVKKLKIKITKKEVIVEEPSEEEIKALEETILKK